MQSKIMWKKTVRPYLFLLPAMLTMLIFLASSVLYNFGISFFRWDLQLPDKPFIGLDNYIKVVSNDAFKTIVMNSVIWTVVGVLLQMILGILIALIVEKLRGWRSGFMQSVVLLPWLVPGVVVALIWMWMLNADLGILNYLLRELHIIGKNLLWLSDKKISLITLIIVNTWSAIPFWFLMITAALKDISRDQIESAMIDGAGEVSIFFHVILQHIKPVIAVTATLTSIWTFNQFNIIWVATGGGPFNATTTMSIYTYRLGFQFYNFGQASAMAVISFLIVAVVCTPYIRSMLKTVEEGGSK